MRISPLTILLLKPSLTSGMLSGLLAFAVLAMANWSFVTKNNPLVYDYLYGSEGLVTNIEMNTDGVSALSASLSSRVLTYEVTVFIVALVVGFTVYAILQSFGKAVNGALNVYQEVQSAGKSKKLSKWEMTAKFTIRTLAIIGWFFFWIVSLKVIFPTSLVASSLAVNSPYTSWYYALSAFAILVVALHLHVIFARLSVLRPRVFGGRDEIILALASDQSRRGVKSSI